MIKMNINNKKEIDTIKSFGDEWDLFDHSNIEIRDLMDSYNRNFYLLEEYGINKNLIGFDMGCGTGRWAKFISPQVKKLYCIDPSEKALNKAKENLNSCKNIEYLCESVFDNSLQSNTFDFGYSIGVLHHVIDTKLAIKECVKKLKKDSPFLMYIYFSFENKSSIYRFIWRLSDVLRRVISKLPFIFKVPICSIIAIAIYLPLARLSLILSLIKIPVGEIPLSQYKNKKFYFMLNDALDRFGTPIENRFSKNEIKSMCEDSGLVDIKFSPYPNYWVCIGRKK